ncbi:MAG: ABC transporter substrate-binding protein [Proteobacteria bacterium]|nr:MAG: ABC transporter substrate-binding protein [Pseudomonadota bacterium]
MNRRDFLALFAGTATLARTSAAYAEHSMRRIGALTSLSESDPEGQLRMAAFRRGLADLGWVEGRNIYIEYRSTSGSAEKGRVLAAELIGMKPDVIFAGNPSVLVPLQQATSTLPIVFVQVGDPVADGFVASLARPGGNITGFAIFEFEIAGKWVELLKEIAPRATRIGVIYETPGRGHLPAIEAALMPGMRSIPYLVRSRAEIEEAIERIASEPNGALIASGGPLTILHRDLIALLGAKHRLPNASAFRYFATAGGLLSYGPDTIDQYRVAAGYVDRILKGEKPADLPVQFPTRYSLVINLKTAKVLGLEVPPMLLARADEVIE